jgi:hypothetical protein
MRIQTLPRLLPLLLLLALTSPLPAQDPQWASKMFEKLDHDFGIVPSGADLKYKLKITNKYQQQVHILSVSSSCGCTAAKPLKDTLASEESTYLDISMDTRRFHHLKETALTVTFDQPLFAQVRIPVKAYINPDVQLNPGEAQFGQIARGKDELRRIAISYAWRGKSAITEAVSKNPNVEARLVESRRDSFTIHYELHVTVKGSAPLGELRDQVTLTTDDPANPSIPVLVEARVEPEYAISPELVSFGKLAPGERKTLNIVARGRTKFTIEKIESDKTAGVFEVRLPKDARTIHVLPLTMIGPAEPGVINEEFTVTISGSPDPVTFKVYGKVVAPPGPMPTPVVGP